MNFVPPVWGICQDLGYWFHQAPKQVLKSADKKTPSLCFYSVKLLMPAFTPNTGAYTSCYQNDWYWGMFDILKKC